MNLPEQSVWINDIYQIERSDPILGGEFGINNVQAKQLASRTQYLLWYFLSFHKSDGSHVLRAQDIASSSKIPEDRFAFDETTEAIHAEIEEMRERYETIIQALENLSTGSIAPAEYLYEALLLAWKYGDTGMDFCLFTPEFTFIPDEGRYRVYRAVSGDDSIDVTASDTLQEGEEYILSFVDNRLPPRLVTVEHVLGLDRVLLSEDVNFNIRDEEEAEPGAAIRYGMLSHSTWSIEDGKATADAGGLLKTKVLTALRNYAYGMLDIGHEHGCSGFEIQVRKIIDGVPQEWKTAELVGTSEADGIDVSTWKFEAGYPVQILIKAISGCVIHFMCTYPESSSYDPQFVRTPYVVGPLKLERYGALYKDPFAKLEVVIDTDPDLSTGATTVELTNTSLVDPTIPVIDVYDTVTDACAASAGNTYYWHARYHAASGKKSMWTPVASFTIEPEA